MTLLWSTLDPFAPDENEQEWLLHEAWRKWAVASCIERHGEHLWYVIVVNHDEDEFTELACEYCPVDVGDVFATDYVDLIHGTLGDLTIEQGRPNLTGEFYLPVNVDFHVEKYTSMNSITPEYDLWIELTAKGHPLLLAEDAPSYSV